jgi:quercetin dioxygenase-like cupin family protein
VTVRWILMIVSLAATTLVDLSPERLAVWDRSPERLALQAKSEEPRVVLDNQWVRVYRTTAGSLSAIEHLPAVVVSLEDSPGAEAGTAPSTRSARSGQAVWLSDAASPSAGADVHGSIVVVQPRGRRAPPPSATGSRPGDAPFAGMSFKPIFENERVSVIRARMEVGAREGFHTHGSDTIVVHLSGGEIEDTADGKTVVNRWQRGDVEFEGFGTSHSARNVGGAVDVVLVALKP